jgi:hypothetical protein
LHRAAAGNLFSFESMNFTKAALPLLMMTGLFLPASGQHKILLLNGKTIETEHYSIGDEYLSYRKGGEKKSLGTLDRYDVFSVTDSAGKENLIYQPVDSLDFTVEEARGFILGEQTAFSVYRKPSTAWSSALIGASSSLLAFYALPVPMVYAVVLGRFNPKVQNVPSTVDPAVAASEPFVYGYQRSARNLKIQRSLKWGYISLGLGLTGLLIYGSVTD